MQSNNIPFGSKAKPFANNLYFQSNDFKVPPFPPEQVNLAIKVTSGVLAVQVTSGLLSVHEVR